MLVTYLDTPPALPARMPSPFATEPHVVARTAAERLRAELRAGLSRELHLDEDGKMFGVLVVVDRDGRFGFLKAFSGMVRGQWLLEGFVPPTFDFDAREAFWPAGECHLAELGARILGLEAQLAPVRAKLDALTATQVSELDELRARHRANREARRLQRAADSTPERHRELDQQSRRDTAERRVFDQRRAAARADLEARVADLVGQRDAIDSDRASKSRGFLARLFATYSLPDARGGAKSLVDIFLPAQPPGGAGDCAAPKLLAYAYRHGLRPIALAEFWCGAPPAIGGRIDGHYYPACRGKCGPILRHMLDGLDVEPAPVFGSDAIASNEPRGLFEDRHLAIVVKPAGLLSVPGKGELIDCVRERLRARYPTATGPLVVHRLDLDTSGLIVVAKDIDTYVAVQRLFTERAVDKRYVAWLDGNVAGDRGTIDLPLRVDLDDRPRQIVDAEHGKPAVTEWLVLERVGGRTRVALMPKTGRAHQLRVHAAHPKGLGVPIVGDRLYGRPDSRLMLHAEAISFVHPHTKEHLVWRDPAPF